MHKELLLVFVATLFLPYAAYAGTPLEIARRHAPDAQLRQVYECPSGRLAVFNRDGGGFLVTTGETLAGYSDSGSFDPAAMPPALEALLREAAGEAPAAESFTYTPVAPLLGEIAFDQLEPYNNLCPNYMGASRSATGCMATAMSQIMRYHKYPEHGYGSNTYNPKLYPAIGTISVDFTQSFYDWENILPSYSGDYTDAQAAAVARLLFDAGVAVNMDYGPQSGGFNEDWPRAIFTHFGYDKGVALRRRPYYTSREWLDMIHADLEAGCPVYAGGYAESGGHAFVFDGMDANGFLHVNWGWSGMCNGYFSINLLTPPTQGTGGANGGFNNNQVIVTGIHPPVEGSEEALSIVCSEALRAPRSASRNLAFDVKLGGYVTNAGWQDATVDFLLQLCDSDGKVLATFAGNENADIPLTGNFRGVTFTGVSIGSDIPDGEYILIAAVRNHGGTRVEKICDSDLAFPHRLNVKINGDDISFAAPKLFDLTCDAPVVDGSIYSRAKCRILADVTNNGETHYHGYLRPVLLDPVTKKRVEMVEGILTDIVPGATESVEMTATFSVSEGDYLLSFYDDDTMLVGKPLSVTVLPAASQSIEVLTPPDFGDNTAVDPANMKATVEVRASGGIFSGSLTLYIYEAGTLVTRCCLPPQFAQLADGETKTVTFEGPFENAVPGAEYDACLVNADNLVYVQPSETGKTRIRIANTGSGVDSPECADETARFFSLQGVELTSRPQSGPYIEISGTKATKILK